MTEKYIDCPKEVMHVFDNNGKTVDRYTISIMFEDDCKTFLIASSKNPAHPLGVWSCLEDGWIDLEELEEDDYIGKEIDWNDLPFEVKSTVVSYFDNFTYWE